MASYGAVWHGRSEEFLDHCELPRSYSAKATPVARLAGFNPLLRVQATTKRSYSRRSIIASLTENWMKPRSSYRTIFTEVPTPQARFIGLGGSSSTGTTGLHLPPTYYAL